tara:strand:- start:566 stop:724 length:159 start_codon:yes stop_codon:yes gene_type:complete
MYANFAIFVAKFAIIWQIKYLVLNSIRVFGGMTKALRVFKGDAVKKTMQIFY